MLPTGFKHYLSLKRATYSRSVNSGTLFTFVRESTFPRLPASCACGEPFIDSHAFSCKKGGFVAQRHNELRDLTGELLAEVCHDVCIEPPLGELTGETLTL